MRVHGGPLGFVGSLLSFVGGPLSFRWGFFGGPLGCSLGIHWKVSMLGVFFVGGP